MPSIAPALNGLLGAVTSRICSIQLVRAAHPAASFITRHGSLTPVRHASTEKSPADADNPTEQPESGKNERKREPRYGPLFPESTPPHSPSYVLVPMPPQHTEHKRTPIKGHLPTPREIFTRRSGGGTAKGMDPEAYVAKIRPFSARQLAAQGPRSTEEAARWRAAALRRKNLVEGLRGLWERKAPRKELRVRRLQRRAEANKAARERPERDADVFTRGTVLQKTLSTFVPLDPDRFAKAEASRVRTKAIAEAKSAGRRDALAQLYMAAEHFIVDEEELEARINKIFVADHFPGIGDPQNIWDHLGPPPKLMDLIRTADNKSTSLVESSTSSSTRAARRQVIVSEELTGGKLERGR